MIDAIAAAYREQDIRTIVVGLAGSETDPKTGGDGREWLSRAAEAGGTSRGSCLHDAEPYCHVDLSQSVDLAADLSRALSNIVDPYRPDPVPCAYALPVAPEGQALDLDAIHVVVWIGAEPILLLRQYDEDCPNGWYLDELALQLRLHHEICALVQSDPTVRFEILVGCES